MSRKKPPGMGGFFIVDALPFQLKYQSANGPLGL